jgi:2,4-dienoyl-CoA reductase-like NADH-dependent reductase (Old Yellow Enzyme family)
MSVGSVGLTEDFISGTFASKKEAVEQSGIDELVERMSNHEFELIAVGRALLQDPAWLIKVQEGRIDDVEAFAKKSLTKLY